MIVAAEPPEPPPQALRHNHRAGAFTDIAIHALALLWLLLPAVQYLGAVQRTIPAHERTSLLAPLAAVDLTPWYILLLAGTIVYAGLRFLARRADEPQPDERPRES